MRSNTWVALLAATGVILGAAYMLYLYRRVVWGEIKSDEVRAMSDLSPRELWLLAPIAAVVLWMGVYPESFLAPMRLDIRALEARLAPAAPAGDSQIKMGAPKPVGEGHHEEAAAHGEAH